MKKGKVQRFLEIWLIFRNLNDIDVWCFVITSFVVTEFIDGQNQNKHTIEKEQLVKDSRENHCKAGKHEFLNLAPMAVR